MISLPSLNRDIGGKVSNSYKAVICITIILWGEDLYIDTYYRILWYKE